MKKAKDESAEIFTGEMKQACVQMVSMVEAMRRKE